MHVGNDITQVLFEQSKLILRWLFNSLSTNIMATLSRLFQTADDFTNFLLTGLDPSYNLAGLDTLEGKDLVELSFKLADE